MRYLKHQQELARDMLELLMKDDIQPEEPGEVTVPQQKTRALDTGLQAVVCEVI